jgi:hypothetical protein
MKKIFLTLAGFFLDDAGDPSCMRLLALFITLAVLGVWIGGNIAAGQYVPLGKAEAALLAAGIGGKVIQDRNE